MIIVHMLARFKSFILSIITLFRRALCCFSRRRKPSYSECEILTSVNVHANQNTTRKQEEVCHFCFHTHFETKNINENNLFTIILQTERDWNSWDDSPRTVTEHIQQYRQKLVQPNAVESNEPAIDFFQVKSSSLLTITKVF